MFIENLWCHQNLKPFINELLIVMTLFYIESALNGFATILKLCYYYVIVQSRYRLCGVYFNLNFFRVPTDVLHNAQKCLLHIWEELPWSWVLCWSGVVILDKNIQDLGKHWPLLFSNQAQHGCRNELLPVWIKIKWIW